MEFRNQCIQPIRDNFQTGSYISSSSYTNVQHPVWTEMDTEVFNKAISELDSDSPTLFEDIMHRLPGKTVTQIVRRYIGDVAHVSNKSKNGRIRDVYVKTRTTAQISTHAQRYFEHLKKNKGKKTGRSVFDIKLEETVTETPNLILIEETPKVIVRDEEIQHEPVSTISNLLPPILASSPSINQIEVETITETLKVNQIDETPEFNLIEERIHPEQVTAATHLLPPSMVYSSRMNHTSRIWQKLSVIWRQSPEQRKLIKYMKHQK
ncbi:hypothetical protein IFM89_002422 [Coptis chinensis]|uniref:Uncharacterized protein n=1 Tax=Coptis chinensis TaxID=261450 RepID=A0A835M6Z7_9MAGN|nr:hypothetical protein IFM89_002422 [Coptis chinensis]